MSLTQGLAGHLRRIADRLDPPPAPLKARSVTVVIEGASTLDPPSLPRAGTAMHPEDIKASLRKNGASLTSIAHRCGVSPSCVSHILHRARSRHVEQAIAEAIGQPPEQIWPERYARTSRKRAVANPECSS